MKMPYPTFPRYQREAPKYDLKRYQSLQHRFIKSVNDRAILHLLQPRPGETVLDVACGTGRGTLLLAEAGCQVVGVDINRPMLEQARRKIHPGLAFPPQFILGNAFDLPFPDNTFHIATAFNFLHLLDYPLKRAVIAQMTRVIVPGGKILVELNNALSMIFVGLFRKYLIHNGKDPYDLDFPFRIQKTLLNPRLEFVGLVGGNFPMLHWGAQLAPGLIRKINALALYPPLKYLANRIYILARKK